MNPHLAAALAAERQSDLERMAGCCTPAAEHRRAAHRQVRDQLSALRSRGGAVRPGACCPVG